MVSGRMRVLYGVREYHSQVRFQGEQEFSMKSGMNKGLISFQEELKFNMVAWKNVGE